jgi:hypothetical protein
MNHANGGAAASGANAHEVPDKLLALTTEAFAFASRERAEGMARQWLAGVLLSNSNEQSVVARSLALELAAERAVPEGDNGLRPAGPCDERAATRGRCRNRRASGAWRWRGSGGVKGDEPSVERLQK